MKESEAHKLALNMSKKDMNACVVQDKWGEFDVLLWDNNNVSEVQLDTRLRDLTVINNYENGKALIA
jgi:hypothetical protein